MNTEQVFIGGQWRAPSSGETYATINPATEEESARVAKRSASVPYTVPLALGAVAVLALDWVGISLP